MGPAITYRDLPSSAVDIGAAPRLTVKHVSVPRAKGLRMVNTAEFVLVESDQVSSVARVNCLARALERTAGIEEFHTSAGYRRISVSFNDVLIDETTLGEKLAEFGYEMQPRG